MGIGEWSQAGVIGRLGCNAQWRITAPEEYWPEQGTPERAKFVEDFPDDEKDEDYEDLDQVTAIGDRRNEIVFIGIDLERDKLEKAPGCVSADDARVDAAPAVAPGAGRSD